MYRSQKSLKAALVTIANPQYKANPPTAYVTS